MAEQKFLSRISNNNILGNLLTNSDSFLEKNPVQSVSFEQSLPAYEKCRFYKIESLTYDKEFPAREALENVLSSMDNKDFSFVYILSGENSEVSLYIGVVRNSLTQSTVSTSSYASRLEKAFRGNFGGSELKSLDRESISKEIFQEGDPSPMIRQGVVCGIPSLTKGSEGKEGILFQGVDRLVNCMAGMKWRITVICQPVNENEIVQLQNKAYELGNYLAKESRQSFQVGRSKTDGSSTSETKGWNSSFSLGKNGSKSQNHDNQSDNSSSDSSGWSSNDTKGKSGSKTDGSSKSVSDSSNVTLEITNKKAQKLLKYLDDEFSKRLDYGLCKGLFKTTVYASSNTNEGFDRLRCNFLSLFQGDTSSFAPLMAEKLNELNRNVPCQLFCTPTSSIDLNPNIPLLYSRPYDQNKELQYATYLTSREVSILAGVPLREVCGIKLKQAVEFGLNINKSSGSESSIPLGYLVQRNIVIEKQPFELDKNVLRKHMFVAGTTGSGKTTACQKILLESKLPFLVIEPAKTEYRGIRDDDVIAITVGDESRIPFRFNMFELMPGESISSHIDQLKATFTNAFPMEASMPMMLEEAMYLCYEKYGWNTRNSKRENESIPVPYEFPMLSDMFGALNEVVDSKGFGDGRLSGDYKGSLVSRISNLTKGAKGAMLNTRKSFDFDALLDKKIIFELESVQSQEEKSFLMGLILGRLSYAIKHRYAKQKNFRHLTLIEEAHHLLSKVDFSDNGSKKNAVEMFSNMLAEVRKYGEGLIIVDQSPNKMTPEVLKNTNTKVIHRLFDQEDKDVIGNTMMMDSKQKEYLSNLDVGHAIVFSENTDKPVHIKFERSKKADTSDNDISDDDLIKRWDNVKDSLYNYPTASDLDYLRDETNVFWKFLVGNNVGLLWKDKSRIRKRYIEIFSRIANKINQDESQLWLDIIKETVFVYGSSVTRLKLLDENFKENMLLLKDMLWSDNEPLNKQLGELTTTIK
jgi:hypothetical protein